MSYTTLRKTNLREWRCWYAMCYRCENNILKYADVEVDEYYTGPQGFVNLIDDMGEQPSPQHRIYRKDKHRNFEPGNLYWGTQSDDWHLRDQTNIKEHAKTLWKYRKTNK